MGRFLYCLLGVFVVTCLYLFSQKSDPTQIQKPSTDDPNTYVVNSEFMHKQNLDSLKNASTPNNSAEINNENLTERQPQGKTPLKEIVVNNKTYPNHKYETLITPNDPNYNQWWVTTNGMTTVWDIPAEPLETVVAIIDTGYALEHEEFSNRFFTNSGESGPATSEAPSNLNCTDQAISLNRSCNNIDDNYDLIVDNETGLTNEENPSDLNCTDQGLALNKSCNNIDDDDNGFIDDVSGWDFSNFDSSAQAGEINPAGSGTTHGTSVAGVLGARGNNGRGIAGVNWLAKIMPLQALDDNSYGDSFTVGQSIYYAVDNGAHIINISLGTNFDDPYLRSAISYALDNNVLVVGAGGNSGCNCLVYPANYPEVIAVGAINSSGVLASFSNYGANLDILAPGQSMATPTYTSSNQTTAYANNVAGTSYATPFVSGILAYGKMLHPDASWEEIVGTMLEYSDRKTNTLNSPRSNTLGFGVVRANTMTDRLRNPQTYAQRVQFDDTTLGTKRNYQCEGGSIPARHFYELKKSGQIRYTSNLRELSKSAQTGWSVKSLGFVCSGLPFDSIETVRVLDLPKEIGNIQFKN